MDGLLYLNIFYWFCYLAFGLYLLRPIPNRYNLMEVKLRLLPFYFKWVGIGVIFLVLLIYFFVIREQSFERAIQILSYRINFGILLIIFSKERNEDELYTHLRLKSIVVSFINTVISAGFAYPIVFIEDELPNRWVFDFWIVLLLFSIFYLIYFYFTKYRLKRELKEKL